MQRLAILLILLTSLFGACSNDGDENNSSAALHGIYEVSSFKVNADSCEGEGAETIEEKNDRFFFLDSAVIWGQTLTQAMSCASIEDCREKRDLWKAQEFFGVQYSFGFTAGGADGLQGQSQSTGFTSRNGACTDGGLTKTILTPTDAETIRIEAKSYLADYPADSEGFCTTTAATTAAANAPCSEHQIITATLAESF